MLGGLHYIVADTSFSSSYHGCLQVLNAAIVHSFCEVLSSSYCSTFTGWWSRANFHSLGIPLRGNLHLLTMKPSATLATALCGCFFSNSLLSLCIPLIPQFRNVARALFLRTTTNIWHSWRFLTMSQLSQCTAHLFTKAALLFCQHCRALYWRLPSTSKPVLQWATTPQPQEKAEADPEQCDDTGRYQYVQERKILGRIAFASSALLSCLLAL
mmetsp:Transcript_13242/g.24983  ORF Transcript_13242/g.24983 Transcript_13242/m.24983 type:complete len:213 (+) Transcript_13242:591-1229(+)